MNKSELEALSRSIADRLTATTAPLVEGPLETLQSAIFDAIAENFRTEAEINREADLALEQLGREATGLDRVKLRQGLRERIAKKKRFVL